MMISTASALSLSHAAMAEPRSYTLDPMHSLAVISYDHVGLSRTFGIVSGFKGTLYLDRDAPEKSSLSVSVPLTGLNTGNDARDDYILNSGDMFRAGDFPVARFQSTAVEVTGETTARVTGDMTLNGVTRPVTFEATFNGETDSYPFPPLNGRPAVGFDALARIRRSDFNAGLFVPYVGDEVTLKISIEAEDLN
jgi:polyisoprenoid-binding protein YceI